LIILLGITLPGKGWPVERIAQGLVESTEVARPPGKQWHVERGNHSRGLAGAFIIAKEERLVSPDRPTETHAEIVVDAEGNAGGEEIAGVESVAIVIFKDTAVELVGARFTYHCHLHRPAKLGRSIGQLHARFSGGLHTGLDGAAADGLVRHRGNPVHGG